MNRVVPVAALTVALGGIVAQAPTASAAITGYRVTVSCTVPKAQPERQLARNSCLNYRPDGTQTFTAVVRDSSGSPVSGVLVTWSDSDTGDALFRLKQNPCITGRNGSCSAELVDRHPRQGERITVTATVAGATGKGYLTFA